MDHYFLSSGINARSALVTPKSGDAGIVGVADAAEDLDGVVKHLEGRLACVAFEHGGVQHDRLTHGFLPCGMHLKALFAGSIPMAVMPIITVCCASGFGGVVAAVPGFQTIVTSLMNLGVNAFTIVFITNICSGICGSASSGENIALQNFGDLFLSSGIPGDQLHRLVAMSSIGLDTLPHSGGVITALSTTKLTHKQAYINNFVLSVVLPIIMACFAAVLISLGIYF